jgi:magnesium-transporting ATPase (P-type)
VQQRSSAVAVLFFTSQPGVAVGGEKDSVQNIWTRDKSFYFVATNSSLAKMGGHGHGEEGANPLHGASKVDLSFNPEERQGLTTEQVEELYQKWGYNELPEIKVSLWWLLFIQFTGTMPYMLELAAIIAISIKDYADFGIILAMLVANAFLGFHEQLKAAESLVSNCNHNFFP